MAASDAVRNSQNQALDAEPPIASFLKSKSLDGNRVILVVLCTNRDTLPIRN